jgi:hypothetical protein
MDNALGYAKTNQESKITNSHTSLVKQNINRHFGATREESGS